MTDHVHNHEGNCWAPEAVYDCKECGEDPCDVCHRHDEPRGECADCKDCPLCAAEDTRVP